MDFENINIKYITILPITWISGLCKFIYVLYDSPLIPSPVFMLVKTFLYLYSYKSNIN